MAGMKWRLVAPLGILLLIGAVVWLDQGREEAAPARRIDCPNLHAGCTVELDGRAVRLGVAGELKVLQPFGVWVKGDGLREVQASFSMESMDMGFNLYTLRPEADGVFRARVTLPVCVSGRRDWRMTLRLDGQPVEVPFVTDL